LIFCQKLFVISVPVCDKVVTLQGKPGSMKLPAACLNTDAAVEAVKAVAVEVAPSDNLATAKPQLSCCPLIMLKSQVRQEDCIAACKTSVQASQHDAE